MHYSVNERRKAIMLIIDIVSWVIVGLVIGAVWAFLASDEHIKLVGTLIFGVIGALVGGFVFVGEAVPGKYSVTALLTSILGAVIFLFIYAVISHRKPRRQPPLDQPASPH
jgi:uncharacterized membrane protein YeaQ/YmgE (transglycosylase-associated protein family)